MPITVLFFGRLAELTQTHKVELQTTAGSVRELETNILELFPTLQNQPYTLALNETITDRDKPIFDSARFAFLPPFAGG